MLIAINPKLPMRNKKSTRDFYIHKLGFEDIGAADYEGYLILKKDHIEIHFFEFKDLNPLENYGQIYIRTEEIQEIYQSIISKNIKFLKRFYFLFKIER